MSIDSYRFLDFATRQVMKAWAARQHAGVIAFTTLAKRLSDCTMALVSTAGIARNDDRLFDPEGERRNPWWGDPSFRVIPWARASPAFASITCTLIQGLDKRPLRDATDTPVDRACAGRRHRAIP